MERAKKTTTYRQEQAPSEPIRTLRRTVQKYGDGLYSNCTDLGVDLLNLKQGSEVDIDIHPNCIIIRPVEDIHE